MKVCPRCEREFPRSEFYENGRRKRAYCRECYRTISAEKRAKNPAAHRAACRRWREKNRERERERVLRWAREHPEMNAANSARARARNPERTRRWFRENRPRIAELARQRRARQRKAFVENVDALVVLELHDGSCGICGDDVDPFDFQIDHIVPLVRGGFHNYANVQPSHPVCNLRKGAKVLAETPIGR